MHTVLINKKNIIIKINIRQKQPSCVHISMKIMSKIPFPLLISYYAQSLHSYFPCNQGLLSQQDFLPPQNGPILPLFPHQQLNKLAGCSEWMLAACCYDGHMVWRGLVFQNNTGRGCHHPSRDFCTKQPTLSVTFV